MAQFHGSSAQPMQEVTLGQYQKQATERLLPHFEANETRSIVNLLLSYGTGLSKVELILASSTNLEFLQIQQMDFFIERLLKNEPLQYVIGETYFAHLKLAVGPGVLIPRPETEELLREVLRQITKISKPIVLDACTGSGCIALAIKSARPDARVEAFDVSSEALLWARLNAKNLGFEINFHQEDLYLVSDNRWTEVNVLVANPPYIPMAEAPSLAPNVRDFEPSVALFVPNNDPLKPYRFLLERGLNWLMPEGLIALELHPPTAESVLQLAQEQGWVSGQILKDMNGFDRMFFARKPTSRVK
jgi:release factor glutamine methyltransferase